MAGIDRFTTAGIEVFALKDGDTVFDETVFPDLDPVVRDSRLRAAGLSGIITEFNAFLLRHPDGACDLVDTGCGSTWGDAAGHLPARLAELGVALTDIRRVILTHLHRDHFGGLFDAEGGKVFPKAEIWLGRAEHARWHGSGEGNAIVTEAYADQITLFDDGDEVAPNVRGWHLPGHTPGQMGLRIGSDLVLVADILHSFALQLPEPEVFAKYDADKPQGIATRKAALAEIAERGLVMASSHAIAGQKFVRLVVDGQGYRAETV
ncbi:MBL fold metallo-hydrolase [Pseudoprimorskyibacter insulae]|uniref:N-acyl homoserine lactonase n=1 Tax=Pseudoprimorskyibacter insulae TaxID=1695997 RepID=A0A2R8AWC4_9RHOB|nr:MBL fold metallo-hydrolase [Pseudoprimorskyibacter insulae]SPF80323.1 N-acyl homoserine lactonase [Pseudoprimorskyibacter insulae]